jgi:ABC-2 type transport system permease protein
MLQKMTDEKARHTCSNRYAAYLSPTTFAAEITQSVTGFLPISLPQTVLAWTVLASISLFLSLLAAKKARWREV